MNEEVYIKFENYLSNQLSLDEKTAFEKQLQTDADLREKFEIFKETNQFLQHKFSSQTADFKANLKSISDENFSKKPKVIAFKPWYFAVAASVALFMGMLFFMQNNNPKFEDYNQYETATFTERGNIIKDLKQAQDAFNAKKYAEAIPLFESVLKSYPRPEIQYFYGISLLEESRFQDCEKVFNVLKSGNSIYKYNAVLGLALSKLKQKDYKSCKEVLLTIPPDFESYNRVQKLLKELD